MDEVLRVRLGDSRRERKRESEMKRDGEREKERVLCGVLVFFSSSLCVILTTRGRPLQNDKENLKRYWMS